MVLYADDSSVARGQIQRTLDALGVRSTGAVNGRAAWDELRRIADHAERCGRPVHDYLQVILPTSKCRRWTATCSPAISRATRASTASRC
jgi:CheY-like chemotaxis protein